MYTSLDEIVKLKKHMTHAYWLEGKLRYVLVGSTEVKQIGSSIYEQIKIQCYNVIEYWSKNNILYI